jgi:hypothetical protein
MPAGLISTAPFLAHAVVTKVVYIRLYARVDRLEDAISHFYNVINELRSNSARRHSHDAGARGF